MIVLFHGLMLMSLFSLFLITSLANILSPGMGVIFAIVLSFQQGWRKTAFFALGQAIGIAILFTAAMSGMGVILASSPTLFNAIKIAGAFFILYLGWRSWHKPAMHFQKDEPTHPDLKAKGVPKDGFSNLSKGVVISLCNPQPIIFGISVLPQFVDPAQPYVAQAVLMISVYSVLVFANLVMYSVLAEKARRFFTGPRGSQLINRATACVFFAIGFLVLGFALWNFV